MKLVKVKKLKALNNSSRNTFLPNYKQVLTKAKPEKSLTKTLKKHAGRNNIGKVTVRHRGGGSKHKYRFIDFKRNKFNVFGTVKTIEYDPNRNCFISLIFYEDGAKRYILTPKDLKIGNKIISSSQAKITVGNALPLEKIPEGTLIHNIELYPGQGGKLVRAAGSSAQVLGLDDSKRYIIVKLVSNEVRKILKNCYATIGEVGNEEHSLLKLGKAGRKRWKGIRPTVRGAAMNANDHPHGGGEGKAPIGRSSPRSKWGKKTMGVKTRHKGKFSSKLIIKSRKKRK